MAQPANIFDRLDQLTQNNWHDWLDQLTARSQQVAEQTTEAAPPVEQSQWHLLFVPEMAEPELLSFDTGEQVAECLRSHAEERGLKVYVFYGWRARISKKPFRYLLDPSGKSYPLFTLPDAVEVQEDDLLGPDPEAELTSTIGEDFETETEDGDWRGGSADEEEEITADEDDIELEDEEDDT